MANNGPQELILEKAKHKYKITEDANPKYSLNESGKELLHEEKLPGGNQIEKKTGKVYIVWSIVGSLLHCMSVFVRGVESADPIPAKFTLSLGYLIIGSIVLAVYRYRRGSEFRYPW